MRQGFLQYDTKHRQKKKDKLGFIKIKIVHQRTGTINKVKRQHDGRTVTNYISDKGLVSRIII